MEEGDSIAASLNLPLEVDDEVQLPEQSHVDKSELEGEGSNKRPRQYSDVWNWFSKKGLAEDGIGRAVCNSCKKEYKCGGKRYGTSSLQRHISKCPLIKGQIKDVDDKRFRKLDQKVSRELCASAIIQHDLPFSFVEYAGIRAWVKYLNPDVVPISRNTVCSDIHKIYLREKEKLKQLLAKIPYRICLTSDVWTACTSEGYISLTAHFVDENWKLNSKILNFSHMPPPHSGVELAGKVSDFLSEWEIEKKVFSLTLDNASSCDNMQEILKNQLTLTDDLLCGGEFFHIRCSAHILNLIVQEGLKVANVALLKIRESVKYVKGSESRMKKFDECVKKAGGIDSSIGLRLDVSTRWNSTYLMLESSIRYKKAFASLQLHDKNYKHCPTHDEWSRAEKICEFLEPFYETTNLISGSSYPTSNIYFLQVWKIECLLLENVDNEDVVISEMCRRMKGKFDKYWSEYSIVLAFGAVLDPRIKLQMLEYFYSKIDASKAKNMVEIVKTKLYKLFQQYANSTTNPNPPCSSQGSQPSILFRPMSIGGGIGTKNKKLIDEIKIYESQNITNAGKSQLDLYLEDPKLEFGYEDFDVLDYWKNHKLRFPILSIMACDVLAIPITTVASESSFSIGARVLNKYRSCMLPEKVQALICTRNWLHGFDANDGDDESPLKGEASLVVEVSTPKVAPEMDDNLNEEERGA